jgi:hypothetical protein
MQFTAFHQSLGTASLLLIASRLSDARHSDLVDAGADV